MTSNVNSINENYPTITTSQKQICDNAKQSNLSKLITRAKNKDEIIKLIKNKYENVSNRFQELEILIKEEPDSKSINIESLRKSFLFMIENKQLQNPQITVDYDGLVYFSWNLKPKGVIGMEFSSSNLIRFTGILYTSKLESSRQSTSGTFLATDIMRSIEPFLKRL